MLAHHPDRPRLISAAQTDIQPAAGEMVRHRDILRQAERIPIRQHQPHLPLPQSFGMLSQIDIEHERVGRNVITFDLEMMLGKHHRGPAGLVGADCLLAQFLDRPVVSVAIKTPKPLAKLGFRRHGDRIEHAKFHSSPLSGEATPRVRRMPKVVASLWAADHPSTRDYAPGAITENNHVGGPWLERDPGRFAVAAGPAELARYFFLLVRS